jgi:hypothetical protein
LTCGPCNSNAGQELDAHIAAAADAAEIATGRKALDTRMTFGGHGITASILFTDQGLDIRGIPSRSSPKEQEGFFQALAQAANQESTDHTFNLTYRDPHDPWRETVAWLRVAYLFVFATLGYNYILQPSLESIRTQIRAPEQKIVPYLVKRVTDHPHKNTIYFIAAPERFRAIAVMVHDRFVVLPDFENPSTLAERVAAMPVEQWPTTFTGIGLATPRTPQYHADFHLAGVLRTLSPYHAQKEES